MSILLVLAAAAILCGVVAVAMGYGGEMTVFARDRPPVQTRPRTPFEVATLWLPSGLFGYQPQATADALAAIADLVADRDAEIAWLRGEVRRLRPLANAALSEPGSTAADLPDGTDRLGTERVGTDRIGMERVADDAVAADRVGQNPGPAASENADRATPAHAGDGAPDGDSVARRDGMAHGDDVAEGDGVASGGGVAGGGGVPGGGGEAGGGGVSDPLDWARSHSESRPAR